MAFLYFSSSSLVRMGLVFLVACSKSPSTILRRSSLLMRLNSLRCSSLSGIIDTSATMFLISLAEQYSSIRTSFFMSLSGKWNSTPFRLRSTISLLAQGSGWSTYTALLNLLLAAESNYLGRLVAPMTSTSPLLALCMPSICTKNQVLSLREASFSFSVLAVSMESISSMKMMEGAMYSAASNIFLMVLSDSPTSLFMTEAADSTKKVQLHQLARALHMYVLPFPGGPYSRMPLGGALMPLYKSGLYLGLITASYRMSLTSLSPTMSSKETSRFLMIRLAMSGSRFANLFSCLKMRLGSCASTLRLCCLISLREGSLGV